MTSKQKNLSLRVKNLASKNRTWAILVFVTTFILYLKTLAPTVTFGDSGEFISSVYVLGIPHPPGYPLYTMLAKLFSLIIPLGSFAWRINLFTAFLATLAVVVVYYIGLELFEKKLPAIFSALLFASSLSFWSYAVAAEIYSLEALLIASSILMLIIYLKGESPPSFILPLFFFIYGLSISHHLTTALYAPPFLFLIAYKKVKSSEKLKIKELGFWVVSFLAGLLPYLYLPIRSAQNPLRNWGDPSTLSRFIEHITARQYTGYLFYSTLTLADCLYKYGQIILKEFLPFLLVLVPLGIWWTFRKRRQLGLFFVLFYLIILFFGLCYYAYDIESFYMPSQLVVALWIGASFDFLIEKVLKIKKGVYAHTLSCIISLLFLSCLIASVIIHYPEVNKSNYYLARDYATRLLKSAGSQSIIAIRGDQAFPIEYLQTVEKKYLDVIMIRISPFDKHLEWYTNNLKQLYPKDKLIQSIRASKIDTKQLLEKALKTRSVYVDDSILEEELLEEYGLEYQGTVFRVLKNQPGIVKITDAEAKLPHKTSRYKDDWTTTMLAYPYVKLIDAYKNINKLEEALKVSQKALSLFPDDSQTLLTVGEIYLQKGAVKEAANYCRQAIRLSPSLPYVHTLLGVAYLKQGYENAAIIEFQKAIILVSSGKPNPDNYYFLGLIYANRKETKKATALLQDFLKMEPKSDRAEQVKKVLKDLKRK